MSSVADNSSAAVTSLAMADDDALLVQRLRDGNEDAFIDIVRRYQSPLIRLASTFVPNRAVAEEVVQDTWVAVLRGIEGFEGRSSFKTWMFRILVNRARTTGGLEHRSFPVDNNGDERFTAAGVWATPPTPWADDVDDRLVAKRLAERARECLDDLPEQQRQVILLRDLESVDAADVCVLLDITDGHQRVLLHRARTTVRGILERELGED